MVRICYIIQVPVEYQVSIGNEEVSDSTSKLFHISLSPSTSNISGIGRICRRGRFPLEKKNVEVYFRFSKSMDTLVAGLTTDGVGKFWSGDRIPKGAACVPLQGGMMT